MILIDRIVRYLKNDIFLPNNCNAKEYNRTFTKCDKCDCKIFCKFPKKDNYAVIKLPKQ
jgi:hypothetical protein